MISPQLLEILRCPLDPVHSRLEVREEGSHAQLVCQRCRLAFPIKEGIPCLLPEEATLPAGVDRLEALPCQVGRPLAAEAQSDNANTPENAS
jgi:uncharacterized protein YbaR (Trm112 family)